MIYQKCFYKMIVAPLLLMVVMNMTAHRNALDARPMRALGGVWIMCMRLGRSVSIYVVLWSMQYVRVACASINAKTGMWAVDVTFGPAPAKVELPMLRVAYTRLYAKLVTCR